MAGGGASGEAGYGSTRHSHQSSALRKLLKSHRVPLGAKFLIYGFGMPATLWGDLRVLYCEQIKRCGETR